MDTEDRIADAMNRIGAGASDTPDRRLQLWRSKEAGKIKDALESLSSTSVGQRLAAFATRESLKIRLMPGGQNLGHYVDGENQVCIALPDLDTETSESLAVKLAPLLRKAEQDAMGFRPLDCRWDAKDHITLNRAKWADFMATQIALAHELNPDLFEEVARELRALGYNEMVEAFLRGIAEARDKAAAAAEARAPDGDGEDADEEGEEEGEGGSGSGGGGGGGPAMAEAFKAFYASPMKAIVDMASLDRFEGLTEFAGDVELNSDLSGEITAEVIKEIGGAPGEDGNYLDGVDLDALNHDGDHAPDVAERLDRIENGNQNRQTVKLVPPKNTLR